MNKKLFVLTIIFILLLFGGDRLLSLGLKSLVDISQNRFIQIYKPGKPADIVIFGNSRADRHFPPKYLSQKLGKRVINLGLGGVSILMEKEILYDYLAHKGNPKLIILEVTNLSVPPNKVGDMRLLGIYSTRIDELTKRYNADLYYSGKFFHLFQFNNEMFLRVLYAINRTPHDRLRKSSIKPLLQNRIALQPPLTKKNYPENAAALRDIIYLAHSRKIPLRLVITPYLPELKFTNYADWKSHLVADIAKNESVWDYSRLLKNNSLFYDSHHLNWRGVKLLLQRLYEDKFFNLDANKNI